MIGEERRKEIHTDEFTINFCNSPLFLAEHLVRAWGLSSLDTKDDSTIFLTLAYEFWE